MAKLCKLKCMYTTFCLYRCPSSSEIHKHTNSTPLGRFTKEGVLVEGLFWKDVEKLIDDYNSERKSK